MNLYNLFLKTAKQQPAHSACIDLGRNDRCSYRDLQERIDSAAENLEKAGPLSGSCIGLHYDSGLQYIVWAYAIWKSGGTVVPIAKELIPEEKANICKSIHLNGVITAPKDKGSFDLFRRNKELPLQSDSVYIPFRRPHGRPRDFARINAAFIRFTSGTTAARKGVVLSHKTIYDRIHAANQGLHIGPSDRIIWLFSMSYHFTVSIVAYISFGATVVLCRDHFGATIVQTAARYKATLIYGSPLHYQLMAGDKSGSRLPDLRLAISTASPLKPEIFDAFLNRFGIPLSQAYGIIEAGLPCINLRRQSQKRGSVGPPLPSYRLRMRNVGLGDDLKAIDLKGKGIIDAYYSPWRERKAIMPQGWFPTGDLGKLDDDGYLYIFGRSNEMICVGGMKIFPREVEAVLETCPGVKEAYVFAREHDRLGEVPYALVVRSPHPGPQPTLAELRKHCLKRLTAYKVPEKIEFVDRLPRTASGKLMRMLRAKAG